MCRAVITTITIRARVSTGRTTARAAPGRTPVMWWSTVRSTSKRPVAPQDACLAVQQHDGKMSTIRCRSKYRLVEPATVLSFRLTAWVFRAGDRCVGLGFRTSHGVRRRPYGYGVSGVTACTWAARSAALHSTPQAEWARRAFRPWVELPDTACGGVRIRTWRFVDAFHGR